MGDEASVDTFAPDDFFLRRVSKKRYIKQGVVSADAFDDKHPTLSLTLQDENLKTEDGLDQYQLAKVLPSGDLAGIIHLSFHDLTENVKPPLPPRFDSDPTDERYGHLHCCIDRPRDKRHRDMLAKCAEDNGVLLSVVRKKQRKL